VRQGEVLLRIESLERAHDVQAAQGALAEAQADLARARLDVSQLDTRAKASAGAAKYLNPDERTSPEFALKAAQARLQSAQAIVRTRADALQLASGHSEALLLHAPARGVVTRLLLPVGAEAAAQAPLLEFLELPVDDVRLFVPVAGAAYLRAEGAQLAISVASDGGRPFRATVASVSPELDEATGELFIEATLFEPPLDLVSGSPCTATSPPGTPNHVETD